MTKRSNALNAELNRIAECTKFFKKMADENAKSKANLNTNELTEALISEAIMHIRTIWAFDESDFELASQKERIINNIERETVLDFEVVSQLIEMPIEGFAEVLEKFSHKEGALIELQDTILKMWTKGIDISAFDNDKSMTLIGFIKSQSR